MIDRQIMLKLLEQAPTTTAELRAWGVTGNPSERRRELEKQGYTILTSPVTVDGRRYQLLELADGDSVGNTGSTESASPDVQVLSPGTPSRAAQEPSGEGEPGQLFEMPAKSSHYYGDAA